MKRILAWLEARLSLRDSVGPMLMHPIPRRRRTRWGGGTSSAAHR